MNALFFCQEKNTLWILRVGICDLKVGVGVEKIKRIVILFVFSFLNFQ